MAKLFGWSEGLSGERREVLEVGSVSGQKLGQVFVVEFKGCGGWLGSRAEALEKWWIRDCRGGIWEEAADCGEGNGVVGCVGLQVWCVG